MDNLQIEVAKNVANNGRLFCALLVFINVMTDHPALAVLSAVPVGASVIVDPLRNKTAKVILSVWIVVFTAIIALISFINAW